LLSGILDRKSARREMHRIPFAAGSGTGQALKIFAGRPCRRRLRARIDDIAAGADSSLPQVTGWPGRTRSQNGPVMGFFVDG